MSPARELRLLTCAVQFLTRLPTPATGPEAPGDLAAASRYFSLVGQGVGLLSAGVWLAAGRLWPGAPAALLAVGAGVLITGALHEDGLADTADGLGGGRSPAQRLAIMKDSRIGSFGALALALVLGLKVALLAGLPPWPGFWALLLAHGGGRAASAAMMAALPYAGDPAAAKVLPPPRGVRWREAAFALACGAWPLAAFPAANAALAAALALAASVAIARLARRLIGGFTGDVLGAVEQAAEVALLMGAAAHLRPA